MNYLLCMLGLLTIYFIIQPIQAYTTSDMFKHFIAESSQPIIIKDKYLSQQLQLHHLVIQ